ncbi:MAG: flavodoxin family protein [Desulfurivibrionaceae bacterium]
MKIACILGSPRKDGNSATIADHFLRTAEGLGAETRIFRLNELDFKGCQACYACKKESDRCIISDDLSEVLDTVREADILVLATPVYFGAITGQLKLFIDRTFSFLNPDFITSSTPSRLTPGKKLVFIAAQGQPDEKLFADIYPHYESFLRWFGYTDNYLIRACGVNSRGEVKKQQQVMDKAESIAMEIVS